MGKELEILDKSGFHLWSSAKSFVLYGLWHLLHFVYETISQLRDTVKALWKSAKLYIVSWDYKQQLIELNQQVKTFAKAPKHLAVSVVVSEDEAYAHQDKLKLVQSVAKTVSYAYAADVRMISLYDYHGVLKTLQGKLRRSIQKEITRVKLILNSAAEKKLETEQVVKEMSLVKIHNVNGNFKENGELLSDSNDELNVFIFSREDGKPVIIEAVKDIYEEKFKNKVNKEGVVPTVTEKMLDTYINRYTFGSSLEKTKFSTEPDLLMVFGKIKSTMGFLPWHIRLSEIHWMPNIHKADVDDFLYSLMKYAGCQQRFGK